MANCTHCRAALPPGAAFCPVCGQAVAGAAGAAVDQPSWDYPGQRYILGHTAASYEIWDRQAFTGAVRKFPHTQEGWSEAWAVFVSLEPGFGSSAQMVPQKSGGERVGLIVAVVLGGFLIFALLIAIAIPTFIGARARANDKLAESHLQNGMAAAKTYFVDRNSYSGISPEALQNIEPAIRFNSSPTPVTGEVSVRPSKDSVVLVTRSESGKTLCIADDPGTGQTFGQQDAQVAAECSGGWPA